MGYAIAILILRRFHGTHGRLAAAKRFQEIADMKGHNGEDYFWWWFGFLCGWAMVMALPDRFKWTGRSCSPNDDLPGYYKGGVIP